MSRVTVYAVGVSRRLHPGGGAEFWRPAEDRADAVAQVAQWQRAVPQWSFVVLSRVRVVEESPWRLEPGPDLGPTSSAVSRSDPSSG